MGTSPKADDGIGVLTTLTVTVLVSGIAFGLMSGGAGRCSGAPRSVRLNFQQRQAAIQQQMAAAQAGQAVPGAAAAPVESIAAPADAEATVDSNDTHD